VVDTAVVEINSIWGGSWHNTIDTTPEEVSVMFASYGDRIETEVILKPECNIPGLVV
jgi:hypothetical protein